jgi:hypothetical protein
MNRSRTLRGRSRRLLILTRRRLLLILARRRLLLILLRGVIWLSQIKRCVPYRRNNCT